MRRSSFFRLVLVVGSLAVFLTACSRDPNVRKQKYFESGQRYFAKGKYREAVIQFRNATEVDGTFAAAHYQLAQSYAKLQDWQHAYGELSRTLELQPGNYKAHVDIANLLIAGGQVKMAQEHTDLLLDKQPNDPDTHLVVANLLAAEQRFDQAIAETQKAIALAPDRGDFYLNLALLQTKSNQHDAAEANFKKAIEFKATAANPHLALADFYFAIGDLEKAISQYESLYNDHPNDLQVEKNYIQLLILKNRLDEANKINERILKSAAKDEDALTYRGEIQIRQGEPNEASRTLQSVVSSSPGNAVAHYQLGLALDQLGDLDRAGAEWEQAARLQPNMIDAHEAIAKLALQKSDMPGLEQ